MIGIEKLEGESQTPAVVPKSELLRLALAAVGNNRAALSRVLGMRPTRITEMFQGKRDLRYDEAKTLVDKLGLVVQAGGDATPLSEEILSDLEKLLGAHLSKLQRDGVPSPEWSRTLVGAVEAYLSPEKIDPSRPHIQAGKAQAGDPKGPRNRGGRSRSN
jgi:hypothetical protein